jgi:hypothetical protein
MLAYRYRGRLYCEPCANDIMLDIDNSTPATTYDRAEYRRRRDSDNAEDWPQGPLDHAEGNCGKCACDLEAEADRPCPCGSGKPSRWYRDARDIELFRGCTDCAPAKLRRYRPEVLTDPHYEASEPIEPE